MQKLINIQNIIPNNGEELTPDQKKIIDSAMYLIEDELTHKRKMLKFSKSKTKEKEVANISYNLLNIQHIRIKLGI